MKQLKFGLSQVRHSAPVWLQNGTAALALLIAAKPFLIAGIPGITTEVLQHVNAWADYVINTTQVLFALALILSGKKPEKFDTDNPN